MNAARTCRCGCGREVRIGRKYRPGHDRVHVEDLARQWRAATGAGREVVEVRARAALTAPLFVEYLRRTGASS